MVIFNQLNLKTLSIAHRELIYSNKNVMEITFDK